VRAGALSDAVHSQLGCDRTTVRGERFAYSDLAATNLLLVSLVQTEATGSANYLTQLSALMPQLTARDTECVITRDCVSGIPCLGVVVADRWGEICYVAHVTSVADLPIARELIEWLDYLQNKCPECEGEVK
jgi:hypothetical protein